MRGRAREQTRTGFDFAFAPFPLSEESFRNGPERSRARRFCAAKRTLDGEDRSGRWRRRERGPAARVGAWRPSLWFLLAWLAPFLAHGFAFQLDAVSIVDQAVQD